MESLWYHLLENPTIYEIYGVHGDHPLRHEVPFSVHRGQP